MESLDTCPREELRGWHDPWQSDFVTDPFAQLQEFREQKPVFFDENTGHWIVTRFDDVRGCFKETERLSAANSLSPIRPLWDSTKALLKASGYQSGDVLVNEDDPVHKVRRRYLSRAFTPEKIKGLEPVIRDLVSRYLDRIIDRGHADLVQDFVYEIPAMVLFHVVGIPDSEVDLVKTWSHCTTEYLFGSLTEEEQNRIADKLGEFWNYSKAHLERLRHSPGDDVISMAIQAQREDPDLWDDIYLIRWCMSLIFAGHETTTNAMANCLRSLLQQPDAWQEICRNPQKIPAAVEESLRFAGSVIAWRRLVKEPVVIGGVDIPAGAKLLLYVASANRDECVFAQGDNFDIDRTNAQRQMTFGFGAHTCLGAPLARTEMRIILEELTKRLPDLRLSPDQTFSYWPANTTNRGVNHLFADWPVGESSGIER